MTWGCFAGLVFDFEKVLISGFSFLSAIAIFLILRKKQLTLGKKMGLIYLHLFTLFFPFTFMTTEVGCGLACMPCANDTMSLIFYSVPTAMIIAGIVGFAI